MSERRLRVANRIKLDIYFNGSEKDMVAAASATATAANIALEAAASAVLAYPGPFGGEEYPDLLGQGGRAVQVIDVVAEETAAFARQELLNPGSTTGITAGFYPNDPGRTAAFTAKSYQIKSNRIITSGSSPGTEAIKVDSTPPVEAKSTSSSVQNPVIEAKLIEAKAGMVTLPADQKEAADARAQKREQLLTKYYLKYWSCKTLGEAEEIETCAPDGGNLMPIYLEIANAMVTRFTDLNHHGLAQSIIRNTQAALSQMLPTERFDNMRTVTSETVREFQELIDDGCSPDTDEEGVANMYDNHNVGVQQYNETLRTMLGDHQQLVSVQARIKVLEGQLRELLECVSGYENDEHSLVNNVATLREQSRELQQLSQAKQNELNQTKVEQEQSKQVQFETNLTTIRAQDVQTPASGMYQRQAPVGYQGLPDLNITRPCQPNTAGHRQGFHLSVPNIGGRGQYSPPRNDHRLPSSSHHTGQALSHRQRAMGYEDWEDQARVASYGNSHWGVTNSPNLQHRNSGTAQGSMYFDQHGRGYPIDQRRQLQHQHQHQHYRQQRQDGSHNGSATFGRSTNNLGLSRNGMARHLHSQHHARQHYRSSLEEHHARQHAPQPQHNLHQLGLQQRQIRQRPLITIRTKGSTSKDLSKAVKAYYTTFEYDSMPTEDAWTLIKYVWEVIAKVITIFTLNYGPDMFSDIPDYRGDLMLNLLKKIYLIPSYTAAKAARTLAQEMLQDACLRKYRTIEEFLRAFNKQCKLFSHHSEPNEYGRSQRLDSKEAIRSFLLDRTANRFLICKERIAEEERTATKNMTKQREDENRHRQFNGQPLLPSQVAPVKMANYLIKEKLVEYEALRIQTCLLYTSPSPRDTDLSRMPSSA